MAREADVLLTMLDSRPVVRDGLLVVHSAFRGLSQAGLRAEAFCEALVEAMDGGTILMPTMTWRTVTPASPVFDELKTPSHTGVLSEVFRTRFATHRSLHPTHSVAGRGPLAKLLLSTHHLGTTPCAGNSPYGLMREYETHVLMVGVGLECCTAMHHAEEMMAPDVYVRSLEEAEEYELVDRLGVTHRVKTRRHLRRLRDFPRFEPMLKERGMLSEGRVHDTRWILFPVRELYKVVLGALSEDEEATLEHAVAR